ncbi:MAG: GxxExxY protein [Bacteroidales bacterium]|nr:GxxExxY protein [Bacteroidales bacterium]
MLLYQEETKKIIKAFYEVYNNLGCGFLENVYQEALAIEFSNQDIPFTKEAMLDIYYKGEKLEKKYFADFICYDKIIIEVKALSRLTTEHEAQILNYLKATNNKVGFLVNFGSDSLMYKRMIF